MALFCIPKLQSSQFRHLTCEFCSCLKHLYYARFISDVETWRCAHSETVNQLFGFQLFGKRFNYIVRRVPWKPLPHFLAREHRKKWQKKKGRENGAKESGVSSWCKHSRFASALTIFSHNVTDRIRRVCLRTRRRCTTSTVGKLSSMKTRPYNIMSDHSEGIAVRQQLTHPDIGFFDVLKAVMKITRGVKADLKSQSVIISATRPVFQDRENPMQSLLSNFSIFVTSFPVSFPVIEVVATRLMTAIARVSRHLDLKLDVADKPSLPRDHVPELLMHAFRAHREPLEMLLLEKGLPISVDTRIFKEIATGLLSLASVLLNQRFEDDMPQFGRKSGTTY
ncbi:hypothetical protein K456DRAFT_39619 [Colletotrichum gloeosporioides 23]|nr:hypothetical protein K456DRAFT_39619 [Colletotrichum gloeosporioides 23]